VFTRPQQHTQTRTRFIQSTARTVHSERTNTSPLTQSTALTLTTSPHSGLRVCIHAGCLRHAGVQLVHAVPKLQYSIFKTSNSRCRVLLETLMVSHLVTKLPAFRSQHPKILYRVQNSPPLLPILSQTEPVHGLPSFFFKMQFKFYPPIYAYVFHVFSSPSVFPFKLFTSPSP